MTPHREQPSQEPDTVEVSVRLRCFVRQEQDHWVSGCPALDVYSQADDADSARAALREAVELWIDSCLERNTLGQALTELGWHRVPAVDRQSFDVVPMESPSRVLGEPFSMEVRIPAFQAAHFADEPERAAS